MLSNYYYGHGKLLLCSEYFVMDGARAIALPTVLGQNMSIKYSRSSKPVLNWKSYNDQGELWLDCNFDLWHFNVDSNRPEAKVLQKILRQARLQNIHFLRDEMSVSVETRIEFPLNWGLGSSSSLIYNIAQWAYVSPFELQTRVFGGSGYDVACAQSLGPISFQKDGLRHSWEAVDFNPLFKKNLYFIYLNKKKSTEEAIKSYYDLKIDDKDKTIERLNSICEDFLNCYDINEFNEIIYEHEAIISEKLKLAQVKSLYFNDFPGAIKSLGAWGGDFALVSSEKPFEEVRRYFLAKNFDIMFKYDDLISQRSINGDSKGVNLIDEIRV